MNKHALLLEAESYAGYITRWRRRLHSMAGTGFDTQESLEFIKSELEAMGIAAQSCGRAGLTALIGSAEGKCFLLRADIDALPIPEESGEDFASRNGRSHACGHDMHAAMLLGAARLLKDHESELRGCVKLMFQSAEEIFEGAEDMINAGVLDSPKVDAAAMLHVMAGVPIPTGTILVSEAGVSAPAADIFEIKVRGRGCHGSTPAMGVDPLTTAARILLAMEELPSRELAADKRATLTFGYVRGGDAPNAIPDTVNMGGSLRTWDEEARAFVKERMETIAQSLAAAFRAETELSFTSGCPSLLNDGGLSALAKQCIEELLGGEKVIDAPGGGGGSEDFAYVSRRVPSIMLALAAGESAKGFVHPQHHPAVRFDEKALPTGAAALAQLAISWL